MRFTTDDGRFGFVLEPTSYSGMYSFQLVVAGELVGDDEPCFLESAMGTLSSLPILEDTRLDAVRHDPPATLILLQTDDALHDVTTLALAESLDRWLLCAYVHDKQATFLAQAYAEDDDALVGSLLTSVVPIADYTAVFGAAHDYWSGLRSPTA